MLLTIVTINRNYSAGVKRTVASLSPLRCDPDVQFLFVDGASTDDSVCVAKMFYKPEEILSEQDLGIYDAMNKGLGMTLGTFVIWINSGDEFISSAWKSLKTRLRKTEASILAGALEVVNQLQMANECSYAILRNTPERLPFQPLHHQAVFFRRSKAIQYGGYPLKYKITADRALIVAMFLAGEPFEFTSIVFARFEEGGISSNSLRRESEGFDLDLEMGLINIFQYFLGKVRNRLYHQVTIPLWDYAKLMCQRIGLETLPKPSLLVRLAKAPRRGG